MKVQLIVVLLWMSAGLMGNDLRQLKFTEVKNEADWNAVFKQAGEENKLVFIDVYTDWCSYCHKLDKEVYTDESVISYFERHFLNVKFDAESEFGYPKAQQFSVTGYPTLLFLTDKGQVFEEIEGFVPAGTLLGYGKAIETKWETLPFLEAKYKSGVISREEQRSLISILETTDEVRANEVAKEYISNLSEKDYLELETIWLLARHQNQLNGKPYRYIKDHKDLMVETHGINEYNDYMSAVYNDNLQLAIKYGDTELLGRLLKEVLPEFIDNGQLPFARYTTSSLYYAERQEFDNYKMEVNTYLNNHLSRDEKPGFILSTTYDIIDSYPSEEMFHFTSQLLKSALEINKKSFEATSLMGYTKSLLGDYKTAKIYLEKAKTMAKDEEEREIVESLFDAMKMMKSGQF